MYATSDAEEYYFMLFLCFFIMESSIKVFTKERLFMLSNLHVQCIKVKYINFILFLHLHF